MKHPLSDAQVQAYQEEGYLLLTPRILPSQ